MINYRKLLWKALRAIFHRRKSYELLENDWIAWRMAQQEERILKSRSGYSDLYENNPSD